MTTKDLRNNIDKVLGNSIRCLLPSYWWKRLFNQVADTIDENTKSIKSTLSGINGVSITESEDSLYDLNVTEGNIASVITKTRTKISECYRVTPDDISSDIDAAIISKCTPVKAVEVIASPQDLPELSYIEFFFVGLEKTANGWEPRALFAVELTGGMVVAFSLSVEEEEYPGAFILSSNSSLAKFNKLLNTYEFRVLIMDDIPEETLAILDNIISIVDVDTNTYVKGAFWEKLVKKDEDNMTVEVLDPAVIEGFALIYAFAQMGNSTDLLPVMTKFFTDGVFNLSVWNSLIQELLEFTEDGESMTDEDAEKLNKMTEAIEQMFEYNKSVYQKLKEKCEASESVVLLVDFSNTAKFGWRIEETPTLVGATHCFPAAMDSYLDINGNFSLKITSPCENATSPIELLPDGTMIFGVDGWVDKTTTVIYIPETSDDIGPRIVENNKQAVKDIYNNGEKIQNFTIKYSIGNGGTIGGEASTLLNVTSENVGSVITIRGLFYYKNQLKQLTLSDDTGIPTVVDIEEDITVDTALSTTSTNPVQNKVVTTAINGKVGKNELKTINGKSILGQGDITIEGGEGGDGVLRIYASNLFNAITEEMLIPEGEELPEEELTFVNTILSTNAKTYNKIIEHYNSLSTLSPIGMTNAIIDYSLIDGFNSGVFTSTPASIVIANVNNELTVSIVPQNEYKSLTSTSGGNFPFLSGWNLNSNGDVKRLEIGTLFVNLADNTLINDGIAAEINNYTKTAIQNGYIDANMVKLVYPLDMGIFEELLAAGASTNAMIAQFGSYFLTSQSIAISYDESLSRNRLFTLGIDGEIITIDIT